MRLKKSFTRKSGVRDARLIVIATEGELTEKTYFQGVAKKFRNSGVHVEILSNSNGMSDPAHRLDELNKFKRSYKINKDDELWLVCDVDRWGPRKLSTVNTLCRQKGYHLSVSNPCFELWLLIHHVTLNEIEDIDQICSTCKSIEVRLRAILGTYNKSNLNFDDFENRITFAMDESNRINNAGEAWPTSYGTKVVELMNSILKG